MSFCMSFTLSLLVARRSRFGELREKPVAFISVDTPASFTGNKGVVIVKPSTYTVTCQRSKSDKQS